VRADKVLRLRELLDKSSSVRGLMEEEKGKCSILECISAKFRQSSVSLTIHSFRDHLGII